MDDENGTLPGYEPPEEALPDYQAASGTTETGSSSSVPPSRAPTEKHPVKAPDASPAPYRVYTSMLDVGEPFTAGAGDKNAHAGGAAAVHHTFVADPAELLPPAVLVLDGQVIHAQTSSPDVVLYQVDRGLASLGPATKQVQLQRLDRRTLADGSVSVRERDLYTLGCLQDFGLPSFVAGVLGERPRFYLSAQSSRTAPLGHWGIRETDTETMDLLPVVFDAYGVFYASKDSSKDATESRGKMKKKSKEADLKHPYFRCRYKTGVCTWTNAEGKEVALMNETAAANPTTTPRLLVTAPLRRDDRDLLVAMWCCYVWEQALCRHVPVPLPRGKNPYKISRKFL